MKIRLLFLLPLLTFLMMGCGDSDSDTAALSVSRSSFNDITPESTAVEFTITCNSTWNISSDQAWCVPSVLSGTNNTDLSLLISANTTTESRSATVSIVSRKTIKTFQVTQLPNSTLNIEHYKLPVIFHVLYKDPADRNQYIDKGRLAEIIKMCNYTFQNKIYQSASANISQDMNLEFVMADKTPKGATLEEPGVERIAWSTLPMSCEDFMSGDDNMAKEYAKMLWDPKSYINIFVYLFDNENILGIAHLPYALSTYPLAGLNKGDYYLKNDVEYAHCVSINSKYIYVNNDDDTYYTTDVNNTLAHELGHYLGLHHAFSEDGDDTDLCADTDYCADTPTYNMTEYINWLNTIDFDDYTFKQLCTRKNCSGTEFVSRNIMDYAFCYSDQFTSDQYKRIRHVLSYSPLIPGTKRYTDAETRSLDSNERPPIQVKK